ncbi:hypothetical protein [Streptomyces kronopolitis]|uniref:hypothetical protein n=1 Tax=Streptomyces kronopolitis TaxID=1612435 RepID=UPI003D98A010
MSGNPSGETAAALIAQAGQVYVPPAVRESAAADADRNARAGGSESAGAEGGQNP